MQQARDQRLVRQVPAPDMEDDVLEPDAASRPEPRERNSHRLSVYRNLYCRLANAGRTMSLLVLPTIVINSCCSFWGTLNLSSVVLKSATIASHCA